MSTVDLPGFKNRLQFSQTMGDCYHLKLLDDWKLYSCNAFTYEILDQIDKNDTQTSDEFSEEVELLKEIWTQKYESDMLY